jgi:Spy/CpxP family protein refolding chaperone
MKTKILMVVMLLGLSASLMAQSTEVVPKQQVKSDQVKMTKEKMDAFQAQRSARLNELKNKMGAQMGQMNGRMGAAMGLNLTDDQKKAFKESALALRKQIKPLKNELGEAEAHQKTLMDAEKTDLGAINKNIEKIAALKVEMAKDMVKFRLEMRSKLTEEQRAKLEMMRGKMQHGKGMKQGKGKPGKNQGRKMRPGQGPQGMGPRGMGPQGMGPGMM